MTAVSLATPASAGPAANGNRLTYLDSSDPYYVGLDFPKLTTPQWVGEEGVEAVVVLAIDDMRDNLPKYEEMLRPILDRLKAIDGRAAVSIMTNHVDPNDPRLQAWIKEGVAIDVHTLTHPCPLLQKNDFAEAARTYHGCVDLLTKIANNRPAAFRMPCCDSLNTPSPRFYAEIFNRTSPEGHFLTIDSSVFNITTPSDPSLPRSLVLEPDGRERFRKYLPFPSFVNTIENYPYPYVIGRLCWEFPCILPSDWEANHLHKPNNPKTVEDLKAALDAVVLKQGTFNLVFHPHGWIQNTQVVELIDHAVKTHGKKVKFLNFQEAQERLDKYLLAGQPLRNPQGQDNGVRVLELNNDGFLDVVIANPHTKLTRTWDPSARRWSEASFPTTLVTNDDREQTRETGLRFGVIDPNALPTILARNDQGVSGAWHFDGRQWKSDPSLLSGLELDGTPIATQKAGVDLGVRLRDIDNDGRCEFIVSNPAQNAIFAYSGDKRTWTRRPFALPDGARLVDSEGRDAGLRFVDLDEDLFDDLVVSNDDRSLVALFESNDKGWTRSVLSTRPGAAGSLPRIVRNGTNNGAWFHSRHLWVQNEDTAKLPDLVDRRSYNDMLKNVDPRGKSPEASLRSIRVRPGFKVELVAQEPLVADPIAFDWGADGRLWVVEMGDYPLGVDGKGKPGGVVRVLEDTDGDGRYDKSTNFLEGLGFPSGLLPWRKGVLVACAPEIFYAEDRDGDGKADFKEVLFTGFTEGNQQHRLNGFDFGLDGWVYGANGDSGGQVRSMKTGAAVGIQGRDFRFRPDDGRFEAESGQTQYGRHRNDWGDWFGNNNPNWAWHYVLADHDLRRNPKFAAPDPKQMLDLDNRCYPVSRTLARFNDLDSANRTTSANSPTPYRDELFGPAFATSLFVSEPVHNLVHRTVLEPAGMTYAGHRPADESSREFLASSDNWFRPTMLKTGPDGALWVADMYRAVIEHPEWIPDDWEKKLDLRAGADQGRIYRVYPVDQKPRPIPRLDKLDTAGLVAALDSPSGWQRDTAQRLLIHAADHAAAEPLRQLLRNSTRPKTRVQALWTLAGLVDLTPETVSTSLADRHPEVRRSALAVGRALLPKHPELGAAMARLEDDPEPRVRSELALALGDWKDEQAGVTLARLIRHDPSDAWLRAAVLSSALPHAGTILTALFAQARTEPPPAGYVEPLFALVGSRPDQLARLIDVVASPDGGRFAGWQFSALAGLLDAADRSRIPLDPARTQDPALKHALTRLSALWQAARTLAAEESAPADDRVQAVRLLGRGPADPGPDIDRLAQLLRPQEPGTLQQAAAQALGRIRDDRVPPALLAGWKSHSPPLRAAILDILLSREAWVPALLTALESHRVAPAELDVARRRRLLGMRSNALRQRASALLAHDTSSREAVLGQYRAALSRTGDPKAGASVFKRVCAVCHRLGGEGVEVGADLATLTDRSPEALLVAILDPNRAFEAKYTNFTISLVDGRILTGMIAAETGNSVTVRKQEGKEEVLLRSEIEEMAGSGQSLMPEGLEKDLSLQDLADLLAFLSASGPARKVVAGNHPETAQPGPRGVVMLKADQAEIYGDRLTLEPKYGNLGLWSAPNDQAAWTFDVDKPGRYRVWFHYACADDSEGNAYVIQEGTHRISGQVNGTGT